MLGIYVHIPFCLKKCSYCDFFSVPTERGALPHAAYRAAIARQLEREVSALSLQERVVSTVFFGGGTPSLMSPDFFSEILSCLRRHFAIDANAEVSCEVNPATADAAWFRGAREAGITRASIGAQSFHAGLLEALGRAHSADDAMRAIAEAEDAGFASVNVDLMYAIPGETMAMLEDDLRTAMTFQPDHVSAYQLTGDARHETRDPRPKTSDGVLVSRLGSRVSSLPSEDEQLKQMRAAARMLERGGWARYEISNFARPGRECRHNLNYWRYGEWLGLGAGATSFVRSDTRHETRDTRPKTSDGVLVSHLGSRVSSLLFGQRWTQARDVAAYLAGNDVLDEDETIDVQTAMGEFCFLGLRMTEGISKAAFERSFGVSLEEVYGEALCWGAERGLVEISGNYCALTSRGMELANVVAERFIVEEDVSPRYR